MKTVFDWLNDAAKENNLYTDYIEVLIVECEIDKFEEL